MLTTMGKALYGICTSLDSRKPKKGRSVDLRTNSDKCPSQDHEHLLLACIHCQEKCTVVTELKRNINSIN